MKKGIFIYMWIAAATLLLPGACADKDDEVDIPDSEKTPVMMVAGIDHNSESMQSRAETPTYEPLAVSSQMRLEVRGILANSNTLSEQFNVTATAKPENTEEIILSGSSIYWDDYDTGNPSNTEGRGKGLTIYGFGVNGKVLNSSQATPFTTLPWSIPEEQTADVITDKDLLISNNVSGSNTYKFANRATPANLIFKHALCKLTVNLIRGTGFDEAQVTTGLEAGIVVKSMVSGGNVNVETGAVALTGSAVDIKMQFAKVTPYNDQNKVFAIGNALLFPGNKLTKGNTLIVVNVNGNVYNVPCDALIEAIEGSSSANESVLAAGKKYVVNVKVSKTVINYVARIMDWTTTTANEVEPVVVNATNYSDGTTGDFATMKRNFRMWYSNNAYSGYTTSTQLLANSPVGFTYDSSNNTVSPNSDMYWPNHTAVYYFRGAYTGDENKVVDVTDDANGDYIPLSHGNKEANDVVYGTHDQYNNPKGAQATTGNIILTFRHQMAKVNVILTTTNDLDKVNLGTSDQDQPQVTLLNIYTTGKTLLGTGVISTTNNVSNEVLIPLSADINDADRLKSMAYVVPQSITGVKLQVVIKNSDNTTDTYTTSALSNIPVKLESSANQSIDKWESGYTYTYTLNIKKSGVGVAAILKDWVTASGSTNVVL